MEEWFEEIKNCKKLTSNTIKREINKNKVPVTQHMNEEPDFCIVDYNYEIAKNSTLGIDRKLDKKLKSGNFIPDMIIDFHGMTLENAFNFLIYNIEEAYRKGLRFLLIITGKGKGTKEGKDSIKSQIEHWMKHPNISSKVVKYVDAQAKDGGKGALYVLIKKYDKFKKK